MRADALPGVIRLPRRLVGRDAVIEEELLGERAPERASRVAAKDDAAGMIELDEQHEARMAGGRIAHH